MIRRLTYYIVSPMVSRTACHPRWNGGSISSAGIRWNFTSQKLAPVLMDWKGLRLWIWFGRVGRVRRRMGLFSRFGQKRFYDHIFNHWSARIRISSFLENLTYVRYSLTFNFLVFFYYCTLFTEKNNLTWTDLQWYWKKINNKQIEIN